MKSLGIILCAVVTTLVVFGIGVVVGNAIYIAMCKLYDKLKSL